MKTFQKIILASAISAAPFASQAMEALDDSVLAATTGQSGVTIEIDIDSTGISVGEIEYTDEGSVALQNIVITDVDKLTQTIDVNDKGDLEIGMSDIEGIKIAIGDNALDTTGQFSALALRSKADVNGDYAETELVNNIDMTLNVGAHTTYIRNMASRDAAEKTLLGVPVAAQAGSVVIQSTAKIQITDMNVGAFGYTADQAAAKVGLTNILDASGVANSATSTLATHSALVDATYTTGYNAYNTNKTTLENSLTTGDVVVTAANGVVSVEDSAGADVTANYTAAVNDVNTNATAYGAKKQADGAVAYANGSAVQLGGVQFYGTDSAGNKTHATISQNIWAQGGDSADGGGVYIQIGQINGTLDIGSISMGNESIGSIKVSDINLAGMTQRIYGHP